MTFAMGGVPHAGSYHWGTDLSSGWDLGPGTNWRGNRGAPHNLHGDLTFLRQHERVLEVPIVTQEEPQVSCRNSRKTKSFSPQSEMRPVPAVASRAQSHLSSWSSKGLLTPLMQFKKFPDIPVSTREEHRGSCHNSRRAPLFPPHLEMRVHFLASVGKESQRSNRTSRGGGVNLKVERNYRVVPRFQKTPMT